MIEWVIIVSCIASLGTSVLNFSNEYTKRKMGATPTIVNNNHFNNPTLHATNKSEQCNNQQVGSNSLVPQAAFKKLMTGSQNSIYSLAKKIITNPVKSALITSVVSYAVIYRSIHNANTTLKNPDSWCNWQSDNPLNDPSLITKLKKAVYAKYTLLSCNESGSNVTQLFFTDIKKELTTLSNYLFWQTKLINIGCNALFPFSYSQSMIETKQKYVQYLLELFMQNLTKKEEFLD
jgi:hypothetical protein